MNKIKDWVNRLKKGHMLSVIGVFFLIIIVLGIFLYRSQALFNRLRTFCKIKPAFLDLRLASMALQVIPKLKSLEIAFSLLCD